MEALRITGPDDDLITKFVDSLKTTGLRIDRISYIFNVEPAIARKWLKDGKTVLDEDRECDTPYETQCLKFYLRTSRAESELESELIDNVRRAADEDWRAAQFLLQSRFRRDWAPSSTIKVDDLSKIDPTKMSDDELQKFIDERLKK